MSVYKHIVGETQVMWEPVRDSEEKPINITAAAAKLYDMSDGTIHATLTVGYEPGRVQTTITAISVIGSYQIEWDISYTDAYDNAAVMSIYSDIEAVLRDSTYLMSLVSRLRPFVDDDPEDPNYRTKSNVQWKHIVTEAVRHFMSPDYSIATNASGQEDISPAVVAGSDAENLIVVRAAHFYYVFNAAAIAGERTAMFQVSYDQAYSQISDKVSLLEDRIKALDPNAVMPLRGETDLEAWGQMSQRFIEAIEDWDT